MSTASRSAVALARATAAGGYSAIAGRRSRTSATRGASSARRSRTMNSSSPLRPRAAPSRRQSIVETGSPGRYGARADHLVALAAAGAGSAPNGRPASGCRGTSGNARRSRAPHALSRPSRAPAAARARGTRALIRASASSRPIVRVSASVRRRRAAAGGRAPAGTGRRRRRDDVVASVDERPRTRGALERQAAAHGRADRDASTSRVARTRSTIQRTIRSST